MYFLFTIDGKTAFGKIIIAHQIHNIGIFLVGHIYEWQLLRQSFVYWDFKLQLISKRT